MTRVSACLSIYGLCKLWLYLTCLSRMTAHAHMYANDMNKRDGAIEASSSLGILSMPLATHDPTRRKPPERPPLWATATAKPPVIVPVVPPPKASDPPSSPRVASKKRSHPVVLAPSAARRGPKGVRKTTATSIRHANVIEASRVRDPGRVPGDPENQPVWLRLLCDGVWKSLVPLVDLQRPLKPCRGCNAVHFAVDEAVLVARCLASVEPGANMTGLPFFLALRSCLDQSDVNLYMCTRCRGVSGITTRELPPFRLEWVLSSGEHVALLCRLLGKSIFWSAKPPVASPQPRSAGNA